MNKNWEKDFEDEFGIHFRGSSGGLKFALAFISELLGEQKQEIVEEIIPEEKEDYTEYPSGCSTEYLCGKCGRWSEKSSNFCWDCGGQIISKEIPLLSSKPNTWNDCIKEIKQRLTKL